MSARPFSCLMRAWPRASQVVRLTAVPLVVMTLGTGCVRTTSLGPAATTDAEAEQRDTPADRPGDGGTEDASAEHQPQVDVRLIDTAVDQGPIVGVGRDASSDASSDSADGARDDGSAVDVAAD